MPAFDEDEFCTVAIMEAGPAHGDIHYRAVVIPQVPGEGFVVQTGTYMEAERICDLLARFQLFCYEQRVMPDYSNAVFVEAWNAKDHEWEDTDE
jgi:hypothetical protein